MAIKTILFLIAFVVCTAGSLFNPIYGLIGYIFHYTVWPEKQWWGNILNPWGVRYSLTFAGATMIGIILNLHRLKWGRRFITSQELLIILFIMVAALTQTLACSDVRLNPDPDPNRLMAKLIKVAILVLMMSHIVTDVKKFRILLWVLVLGALHLGVQAYNAPIHDFYQSRLNNIGGPDFVESSFFGAHLVAMLPFLGIFFLCGTIRMKLVSLVTTGFVVNAIVLTRTRAALIAMVVGLLAALVLKLKRRKLRLILCLFPAAAGAYWLTDTGFWARMETIINPPEERDSSAADRLVVWSAGARMVMEHPLGVGIGNFAYAIRLWDPDGVQRDAHNTLLRCAGELGLHSAALLLIIILNGWLTIYLAWRKCRGSPEETEIQYYCYAVLVCQLSYFAAGMFMTCLYIEEFWWFLMLPVCLLRCAENAKAGATPGETKRPVNANVPSQLGYGLAPVAWGKAACPWLGGKMT
jgi:O-antigen ligase